MLTPSQLDHYPDSLVELYAQVEADILADMARKINSTNYYTAASQWQRQKLYELGNTYDDIMRRLSAVSGKSKEELRRIMQESCTETLRNDDDIYKAAGLSPGNVNQSPALLNVLNAGLKKTNGTFDNLTKTTANTATKQFEHALDRAYMQITTGAFSPQAAIKIAIKDLAKDGLNAIEYPSGHIDHLDVAVRRAVITGVNQTAATLQITRANEMGCDLVEVTAHAGARPSHAVWQGGIYSLSGQSKEYAGLEEATGYGTGAGLCGWNCRHSFFPYYPGISRPAYTPEELERFNAKAYEYNGVKMTEYEATQKQRYIERQIRRWKREEQAMNAAGLPTEEAKAKVAHWKAVQKDYLAKTGLKRQYDREWVHSAQMPLRQTGKGGTIKKKLEIKELDKLKQSGMAATDYQEYLNLINGHSNEDIIRLYAEYADKIAKVSLKNSGGVYQPSTVTLDFGYPTHTGMNKYGTLAHEYGHFFDAQAEFDGLHFKEMEAVRKATGFNKTFEDVASTSDEFLAAIRSDRVHIKSIFTAEAKADLIAHHASSGVQDAIDGLFANSRLYWGHGEKYYNRKYASVASFDRMCKTTKKKDLQQVYKNLGLDASNQEKTKLICRQYEAASEAWANIMSAEVCGGEALEYVKKYLPNSYQAMLDILKGVKVNG